MSLSKGKDDNIFEKALKTYVRLLREKPVLTKSLTCAFTSGLGSTLSQLLAQSGNGSWKLNLRNIAAYTTCGFIFVGPITHHFYIWLEKAVPRGQAYCALKRLILDRFIFAPPFLLIYFYLLAILEGRGSDAAIENIRQTFWTTLKMNWRVWTVFQYINLKYVPQQFRVLFGNMIALFWTIYVAKTRNV